MIVPRLISCQIKGKSEEGFLSIVANDALPFEIKRVFWAYGTPEHVVRGNHAHKKTEMVLIAVRGEILVTCQIIPDYKKEFLLNDPNVGLYIPTMCWHTMQYSRDAVQVVIVNTLYDESDYIRDYTRFMQGE